MLSLTLKQTNCSVTFSQCLENMLVKFWFKFRIPHMICLLLEVSIFLSINYISLKSTSNDTLPTEKSIYLHYICLESQHNKQIKTILTQTQWNNLKTQNQGSLSDSVDWDSHSRYSTPISILGYLRQFIFTLLHSKVKQPETGEVWGFFDPSQWL